MAHTTCLDFIPGVKTAQAPSQLDRSRLIHVHLSKDRSNASAYIKTSDITTVGNFVKDANSQLSLQDTQLCILLPDGNGMFLSLNIKSVMMLILIKRFDHLQTKQWLRCGHNGNHICFNISKNRKGSSTS